MQPAPVEGPLRILRLRDAARAELDAVAAVHDACGSGAPVCAAIVRAWGAIAAFAAALEDEARGATAGTSTLDPAPGSEGLPPRAVGEIAGAFVDQVRLGSTLAPGEPFDAPSDAELRRHRRRLLGAFADLDGRSRRLAPPRRKERLQMAMVILGGVLAIGAVLFVLHRPRWRVSYFGNMALAGPPAFQSRLHAADREWGYSGPGNGVPNDLFSARFESCLHLSRDERVRFSVGSDDGSRLFVDRDEVIDGWVEQGYTKRDAVVALKAGVHKLRLEFFEHSGGARLTFAASDDASGADLAGHVRLPEGPDATCPPR